METALSGICSIVTRNPEGCLLIEGRRIWDYNKQIVTFIVEPSLIFGSNYVTKRERN